MLVSDSEDKVYQVVPVVIKLCYQPHSLDRRNKGQAWLVRLVSTEAREVAWLISEADRADRYNSSPYH